MACWIAIFFLDILQKYFEIERQRQFAVSRRSSASLCFAIPDCLHPSRVHSVHNPPLNKSVFTLGLEKTSAVDLTIRIPFSEETFIH